MDKQKAYQHIVAEMAELAKRSQISEEARAPVMLDQQSVGRLSRMDAIQQQSMELATEERRRLRLAQLQAALDRIAADEFGWCLTCGEEIASARLEIDPASATCVDCRQGG